MPTASSLGPKPPSAIAAPRRISRRAVLSLLGAPAVLTLGQGLAAGLGSGPARAATPAVAVRRIVTIGADLTETVAELDGLDRLVGCDRTSRRPAPVRQRATIGYFRAVSAEGVISLKPDLVIATAQLGPDGVADQVAAAGITVAYVDDEPTVDGIRRKIDKVAELIDRQDRAKAMIAEIDRVAGELDQRLAASHRRPRLLFVLSADAGSAMAAGDIAPISAAIALASAENAGKGWKNVKAVSREAFMAAPPDGLLTTPDVMAKAGGAEGLLKLTGFDVALAPAAVLAIDAGPFMLFGPSTPMIARDVARHYLPELFKGERG